MEIEELVKKHMEEQDWYNFPDDSLRAALNELVAKYEEQLAESKRKLEVSGYSWSLMGEELNALRAELADSREHIRQLEAAHAIELRAYEATVENLEAKIARLTAGLDEITGLSINLRQGGCDSSDLRGLEEGLIHAIDIAYEMLSMLADAPQPKKEGE